MLLNIEQFPSKVKNVFFNLEYSYTYKSVMSISFHKRDQLNLEAEGGWTTLATNLLKQGL